MSAAWTLHLATLGVSIPAALLLGFLMALAAGVVNGLLIAYVEIPALFATLGMASLVFGLVRWFLVPLEVVYMPASADSISWIGGGFVSGDADADPVFRADIFPRLCVSALHQAGAVHLCDWRQFCGRADFRRARASNHRAAICLVRVDRLCRGNDHRDGGLQHEHQRRELLVDLRCHPGRRDWRHRAFGRPRRHPQRDRRHAA